MGVSAACCPGISSSPCHPPRRLQEPPLRAAWPRQKRWGPAAALRRPGLLQACGRKAQPAHAGRPGGPAWGTTAVTAGADGGRPRTRNAVRVAPHLISVTTGTDGHALVVPLSQARGSGLQGPRRSHEPGTEPSPAGPRSPSSRPSSHPVSSGNRPQSPARSLLLSGHLQRVAEWVAAAPRGTATARSLPWCKYVRRGRGPGPTVTATNQPSKSLKTWPSAPRAGAGGLSPRVQGLRQTTADPGTGTRPHLPGRRLSPSCPAPAVPAPPICAAASPDPSGESPVRPGPRGPVLRNTSRPAPTRPPRGW